MRRSSAILVAAAVLLTSYPAWPCSPSTVPFSKRISSSELAVKANAEFTFTETSAERLAGTARLSILRCYRYPKDLGRCPSSLTVHFDEVLDGVNCPPDVIAAVTKEKLRYFLLWREGERWFIGIANRHYDRSW